MPRASERRENRKAPVAIGKRHVGDLVRSSACLRDRARFRWGTGERASGEDGRGRGQAPAPLSRTRVQAGDYVFSSVTIVAVTEEFSVRWHAPRFAQDYPGVTTGCCTSRGPLRSRHARSRPCWGDHIGERGVAPSDGSRHPGRRAERGRCASAGQTDRCRSRLPVRHPGNSTRPLGRRSGGRGRQPALAGGQSPAPRQPRFARSARPAAARRRARTVVGHRCCHLAATLSENK